MKTFLFSATAAFAAAAFAPASAQTAASPAAPVPSAPARHMRMMKPVTRAAFVQKAQKLFARLDANHDGFVTQDEVQASSQKMRDMMTQRMGNGGSKMFDRLDANRDGVVTQAEFDSAMANRPQRAGSHRPAPTWERFAARFDSNHDGQISRAEFESGHAQRHMAENGKPHPHRAGFAAQMFAMADVNHDGRVSLQEAIQTAQNWFDTADSNHDGVLSPDEMRAMHKGMHPR